MTESRKHRAKIPKKGILSKNGLQRIYERLGRACIPLLGTCSVHWNEHNTKSESYVRYKDSTNLAEIR